MHLHDNGAPRGQHRLPFDGNIDWNALAAKLKAVGYRGAITLEPMNWDYTDTDIRGFLSLAFEKAKKLEKMILQ